jgi:hypothetical protein
MRRAIAVSFFALLGIFCGKHVFDDPVSWNVTFHNESSYSISVYQNSFSGAALVDMLPSGDSHSAMVRPSDNYGSGTVFSIKYWFRVGENVWTGGIDPNAQIQRNVEAGKNYDIQIPNALNVEWTESFVIIQNSSNMPLEFNYLNDFYKQAGNGETAVPSGKFGIYKISGEINGRTITQVFEKYPFPNFTAEKGRVYNFMFDGSSVIKTSEYEI